MLSTEGASEPTSLNLISSHYYTICEGYVANPRCPITKQLLLLASCLAKLSLNSIIVLLMSVLVHTSHSAKP